MKMRFKRRVGASTAAVLCLFLVAGCTTWPGYDGNAETVEDAELQPHDPTFSRTDQSPGFFRMRMGDYFVTALYDGSVEINSMLMKGRPQATINRLLRQAKQPRDVKASVNAFLLDDGERIILIDTGASEVLGDSMGQLASSIGMSGYTPEDIKVVLLTHLHPDHAGGLLRNGEMAFPNAQIHIPQAEAAHWFSSNRNDGSLPLFQGVLKALEPYQKARRVHIFEAGEKPIPGIESVSLAGHSPGHTGYRIRTSSESLFIWGDIVHSHTAQFVDPVISLEFDDDQKKARLTRTKALRDAANSGEWIAGSHLPFPGIGRVQSIGKTSYRWLPIDYTQAMSEADQRKPLGAK